MTLGASAGRARSRAASSARRSGRRADAEQAAGAADRESASTGLPAAEVDPEAVARQICLHLIEHAPRTRAQLAAALARKGVDPAVSEAVLGRFSEVGLVDDEAFARAWVSSRHTGRGLSRRALSYELRQRGVDEQILNEAVETLAPEQERDTARALVLRKLAASHGLAPEVRVRRLVGMLARKGYGPGLAFRVVREALAQDGLDPDLLAVPEP